MSTSPSMVVRIWRVAPWSRNPLMRASDRMQGLVAVLAVLAMLLAVPVAAAAGTAEYTGSAASLRADNATKTAVSAMVSGPVTSDSTTDTTGHVSITYRAPVSWSLSGRDGRATTEVSGPQARTVTVWLGPDGRLTAPPTPPETAVFRGIGTAVGMIAGIWMAAVVLVFLAHRLAGARNRAVWGHEWQLINRPIGQGT
jgi:hypothetical protein